MLLKHFMPRRRLAMVTILGLMHGAAFARQMPPGAVQENMDAPGVLFLRADVTAFERRIGNGRVCYDISYEVREVYRGSAVGPLSVTNCASASADDISRLLQQPKEARETETDAFGFEKGAEVLVGLTTEPPPKGYNLEPQKVGALRLLSPTCWGPMQYRLDKVPESQRAEMLNTFKDSLRKNKEP